MFELCVLTGRWNHPNDMKAELPWTEIVEWLVWLNKEPRGDRRTDVNFAVQTAYLRQCWIQGAEDPTSFLVRFDDNVIIHDPEVEKLVDDFLSVDSLMGLYE